MTPPKKELVPSAGRPHGRTVGTLSASQRSVIEAFTSTQVFQLTINYHHTTVGLVQNVMHCMPDTDPTADVIDVLNDLTDAFLDANQDNLLPMLGMDMLLSSYSARRLTGGSPTITRTVALYGTATTAIDNTAIAYKIAFIPKTAPWNYGHFYVPGVPDNAMNGNIFDPTYDDKGGVLGASLIGPWTHTGGSLGLTWHLVILQRAAAGSGGVGTPRPVDAWSTDQKPSAIGRRIRPYSLAF
jgi:hypothetical protein